MDKRKYIPKNEGNFHVIRIKDYIYNAAIEKMKSEFFVGAPTGFIESLIWSYANHQLKKSVELEDLVNSLRAEIRQLTADAIEVRYPKSVGAKPSETAESERDSKRMKGNERG